MMKKVPNIRLLPFHFFQYFAMSNIETSFQFKYLNFNDVEFPRLVLCLPEDEIDEETKISFEKHLLIHYFNSSAPYNESFLQPVFKPVVIDFGYNEASGFETGFRSCYRLERPSLYYRFLIPKNTTFDLSLDVFVSVLNHWNFWFMSDSQKMSLNISQAQGGCLEFHIANLYKYEFNISRRREFFSETEDNILNPYNQGYCLDYCIQEKLFGDTSYR